MILNNSLRISKDMIWPDNKCSNYKARAGAHILYVNMRDESASPISSACRAWEHFLCVVRARTHVQNMYVFARQFGRWGRNGARRWGEEDIAGPTASSTRCSHPTGTMILRDYDTMILLHYDTMILWYYSTMILWYYDTMILLHYDTMILLYYDTMILLHYDIMILLYYDYMI